MSALLLQLDALNKEGRDVQHKTKIPLLIDHDGSFRSFFMHSVWVSHAQTGCPPVSQNGWRQCATVYYTVGGFDADQYGQILNGIDSWKTHNSTNNNSRVSFVQGTPPSGATNYGTLTIQTGTTTGGDPAETVKSNTTGAITSATITFYLAATIPNTSPTQLAFDPGVIGYDTIFKKVILHELGHSMGVKDEPKLTTTCYGQASQNTVMNGICGQNDRFNNMPTKVKGCDDQSVNSETTLYPANPQCAVTPPPGGGGSCPSCGYAPTGYYCAYSINYTCWPYGGCPSGTTPENTSGCCCFWSPIPVDVLGDGFDLTDAINGVQFDAGGDGRPDLVAWPSPNSDEAWLALDRNGNGTIDNGLELFGNFTSQPQSTENNGFLALAVFDNPGSGGNGDGLINSSDAIFSQLRLWQYSNHNGISESNELHALPSLGLYAFSLDFKVSNRTDRYGNRFRYRAKVYDVKGAHVGRWAWDVFPQINPD
jgi:hypothetical protein